MLAPPPIQLPEDPAAIAMDKVTPSNPVFSTTLNEVATEHPESPLVWALLAEAALKKAETKAAADTPHERSYLVAYAFARTGYHRGLDLLRANGWKGWGPVPFDHKPNQGVLRAIAVLAHSARAIGETEEYDRLRQMLSDADPNVVEKLLDS